MELQARIGGNLFWKFLDVCEEKLLVTAWTLKIIVGDLTFSHGLYSYRTWKSCQNVQTQVEPRAVAKCQVQILNILTSFLWSIKEKTMENWCWFVIYNNIGNFDVHCRSSFLENPTWEKEKNKLPTTFTSFSRSVLLSTIALDQSVCKKLLSYGKKHNVRWPHKIGMSEKLRPWKLRTQTPPWKSDL